MLSTVGRTTILMMATYFLLACGGPGPTPALLGASGKAEVGQENNGRNLTAEGSTVLNLRALSYQLLVVKYSNADGSSVVGESVRFKISPALFREISVPSVSDSVVTDRDGQARASLTIPSGAKSNFLVEVTADDAEKLSFAVILQH